MYICTFHDRHGKQISFWFCVFWFCVLLRKLDRQNKFGQKKKISYSHSKSLNTTKQQKALQEDLMAWTFLKYSLMLVSGGLISLSIQITQNTRNHSFILTFTSTNGHANTQTYQCVSFYSPQNHVWQYIHRGMDLCRFVRTFPVDLIEFWGIGDSLRCFVAVWSFDLSSVISPTGVQPFVRVAVTFWIDAFSSLIYNQQKVEGAPESLWAHSTAPSLMTSCTVKRT